MVLWVLVFIIPTEVKLSKAERKQFLRMTAIIKAYDCLLSVLEEEYYVVQGRSEEPEEMKLLKAKRDGWFKKRQKFLEQRLEGA